MKNWKTNEMIYFYSLEDKKPGPRHIRDSHGITPPPRTDGYFIKEKGGGSALGGGTFLDCKNCSHGQP